MTAPLKVSIGDRITAGIARVADFVSADQAEELAEMSLERGADFLAIARARRWRKVAEERRAARKGG